MAGFVFDHDADRARPLGTARFVAGALVLASLAGAALWWIARSGGEVSAAARPKLIATPRGADSATRREAANALVDAVRAGDLDLVETLLRRGANPNARDSEGVNALCRAIRCGETAIARRLFEAGARLPDDAKQAADELARAVVFDDAELIEMLLARGVRIDQRSNEFDGASPLHLGAEAGKLASIAALLRAKADIDARDDHGFTPLARAVLLAREEAIDLLLARGADAASIDAFGRTTLHLAAAVGQLDSVEMLLAAGVDPAGTDALGWTALHAAAAHGRCDVIAALARTMDRPALDCRTARGATALHLAARRGDDDCVQALLAVGLDPGLRDLDGRTARDLSPRELTGAPWSELGPRSPRPPQRRPEPALLDFASRRPLICLSTHPARTLRGPLVLLDLAVWDDGATVFAPWSADGSRNYVAGVLSPNEVSALMFDLEETGWLGPESPVLARRQRDRVELAVQTSSGRRRIAWEAVEAHSESQAWPQERSDGDGFASQAAAVDWSLRWARVHDILRRAPPGEARELSFVLVQGSFRGLSFQDGAQASWLE